MVVVEKKRILYIASGTHWSMRERTVLRDVQIALENLYKVTVLVTEDSYLHTELKKLNVEVFFIGNHFLNRLTSFHDFVGLRTLFRKYGDEIQVIHIYEFNFLVGLSLQLLRKSLVSLVITSDSLVDDELRHFWYRPIITRIDSLIIIHKYLKNDVIGGLLLPHKKVDYFGMPLIHDKKLLLQPEIPDEVLGHSKINAYTHNLLIGTYVSPTLENFEDLIPIISALYVMKQKVNLEKELERPLKLVLVGMVEFQSLKIFTALMNYIDAHQLNDDILFVTAIDVELIQKKFHLWVSLDPYAMVEDYALSAITKDIPIILPRNVCSAELLRDFQGIGETYKLGDSRELREKIEKALKNIGPYTQNTQVFKYFFEKEYSTIHYKNNLLGLYSRIIQRRSRLFKK